MKDKCFLILGGGGMVGFQVTHRIVRRLEPEKVIIASLYQKEVREAINDLEKNYPDIEFVGFWGNVFGRREFNIGDRQQRVSRNQLLESPEYRASLFDDLFGGFGMRRAAVLTLDQLERRLALPVAGNLRLQLQADEDVLDLILHPQRRDLDLVALPAALILQLLGFYLLRR